MTVLASASDGSSYVILYQSSGYKIVAHLRHDVLLSLVFVPRLVGYEKLVRPTEVTSPLR